MKLISIGIGVVIASIGLMFIILYTNLLTIGYSFWDFVKFISTRFECLLFVLGVLIILNSFERGLKNVLFLRHTTKFSR